MELSTEGGGSCTRAAAITDWLGTGSIISGLLSLPVSPIVLIINFSNFSVSDSDYE